MSDNMTVTIRSFPKAWGLSPLIHYLVYGRYWLEHMAPITGTSHWDSLHLLIEQKAKKNSAFGD